MDVPISVECFLSTPFELKSSIKARLFSGSNPVCNISLIFSAMHSIMAKMMSLMEFSRMFNLVRL